MTAVGVETARAHRSRSTERWFTLACIAAGLLSAGFLILLHVSRPGDRVAVFVDNTGSFATALLAAAGCGAAAWRHRGRLRAAWLLLALGALCWAIGEGIWGWLAIVQGNRDPFPSLADAAHLAAVPPFAAGILLLRPASESMRTRLRSIADGVIIAVSLLTISWVTVLGAVWAAGGVSPLTLGLSIAYPTSDVLLLTMLVFLAMGVPGGGRVSVRLLIAGVALLALADSAFAYLSTANIYSPSNLIDAGYWMGYLLIALAGLRAAINPIPARRGAVPHGRITLMLPYAPATVALGVALWAEVNNGLDEFLFICLAVLIGAVLLRQFLALSDNLLLVRDLANREHELRHQADHDALTGLANRGYLQRAIDVRLAAKNRNPCALLFIDVDDLKPINDLHGHAGGDAVLGAVAARLCESVRGGDLVARIGGDEFMILLPDLTTAAKAMEVAERIVVSMATPLAIVGGQTIEVSVSIGIATADGDSELLGEELIRRADTAMYAAKAACKGIAVEWSARLDSAPNHSESWKSDLERAAAEHQFVVHYQPIVETASQRIVSVEALLRWQHPRDGLLLPARFLDDLETSGLIVQVGEWVLNTACHQIRILSEQLGIRLGVHVNLSARQLARPDCPHVVRRALEASHLPAHQLVVELTETSLVESHRAAAARLQAIKRLGCRVALDDFGTGYSSIAHLREFPIDVIKVDRSFITDLTLDAAKPSLAAVLIDLAASIDKQVIAEGVETEEQIRALLALHCALYQGFYFSPAVDLGRLTAMLLAVPDARLGARVA